MHTILENVQPLRVTIEPVDAPWCTGGSGRVRFTITNDGTDDETLDAFRIILNGGMAKYPLLPSNSAAARTPVALAPAETRSWDLEVVIPAVPPGQYPLQLYGFSESAMVEILGPRACATDDLAAVAGPTDSAMGHSSTAITVTNVGDDACFIGTPLWAQGTAAGGSTPQLTVDFGAPSYFPTTDPRPSRTLLPGERTITILATSAACVDTVVPTYWTHLQLVLDWSRHAVLDIDLGAGSAVQTDCGGAFSGWSVAPR